MMRCILWGSITSRNRPFVMSDSSSEPESTADQRPTGEPEDDEGTRLWSVYNYLSEGKYPHGTSKDEKRMIRKKSKKYSVSNGDGQLTYKTKNGNEVEVIFSEEERKRILKVCQTDPTAGHLGRSKTYYKVAERYYWSGLYKDVVKLVRTFAW